MDPAPNQHMLPAKRYGGAHEPARPSSTVQMRARFGYGRSSRPPAPNCRSSTLPIPVRRSSSIPASTGRGCTQLWGTGRQRTIPIARPLPVARSAAHPTRLRQALARVTPVTGFPVRRGQDGSMKAIETSLLGDPIVVPHETTLELYRKMLTVFFVEERMKIFVKQGKCSFNASTRGHEKVQIGMTMLLRPGFDWFFPYYRSKALAIGLGMPLKDVFLGMLSREGDPNSNGRNMAEHFSSRELNLVSRTAVTATQYLNAVGVARALRRGRRRSCRPRFIRRGRHQRGRILRGAQLGGARETAGRIPGAEQWLRDQRSAASADRLRGPPHRAGLRDSDLPPGRDLV